MCQLSGWRKRDPAFRRTKAEGCDRKSHGGKLISLCIYNLAKMSKVVEKQQKTEGSHRKSHGGKTHLSKEVLNICQKKAEGCDRKSHGRKTHLSEKKLLAFIILQKNVKSCQNCKKNRGFSLQEPWLENSFSPL